jgi:uncharacterized membrane protein YhhN
MNNNPYTMTRSGAYLRAALIVIIAILGFLLADESLRKSVPPVCVSIMGAALAGCAALRGWLDQSESQSRVTTEVKKDEDQS